jgi:PKD repeat protein
MRISYMLSKRIKIALFLVFFKSFVGFSTPVDLVSPFNGANIESNTVTFSWNKVYTDINFTIEISTDSTFSTINHSSTLIDNTFAYTLPTQNTYYYWRVKSNDRPFSEVRTLIWFTPKMVSNLKVWVRSDTGVVHLNGKVSKWNDLSGNNIHLSQADTSKQAIFISNDVANTMKPSLSFDGVNDELTFAQTNIKTSFVFFKHSTGTNTIGVSSGKNPGMLNATTNDYVGAETNLLLFQYNPANNVMKGQSFDFGDSILPTLMTKPTNYNLINHIHSGTILKGIGRGFANTTFWQGNYVEVILFADSISYSNRKKVENYTYSRYTPPVNLGTDKIANSFCDTYNLNAGNGYQSYLWSNGSTSQNIVANAIGDYFVTVTDIHGKKSIDTITLYPPMEKLQGRTYSFCKGDSVKVDLKLPSNFSAQWSDGRSGGSLYFKNNGKYIVSIKDANDCILVDSIMINVDSIAISPSIIGNNLSICTGKPLVISTPSNFSSIVWSTGSNNDTIFVNTSGNYSINASTINGCTFNKNFNVSIIGISPTIDFNNNTVCLGKSVDFTDLSTAPSGNSFINWQWNFGDGGTSSEQNPSHSFNTPGATKVSLTATTNVGCSNSIERNIVVNENPNANFYFPIICSNNTNRFFDSSTVSNGNIVSWNWNIANIATSFDKNPFVSFPSKGVYNVTLLVKSSNGCEGNITKSVNVLASPVSNFISTSPCVGEVVSFTNLSSIDPSTNIVSRSWYFGDGTSSNLTNPTKGYSLSGNYTVTLINLSNQGCVDSITKTITVNNFPTPKFELVSSPCANTPLIFADSSTQLDLPINQWQWKVNNVFSAATKNLSLDQLPVGNYNIELKVTNSSGCSATRIKSYAITAPPIVDFDLDPEYAEPPANVNFTNNSPSNLSFVWNFGDGPIGAFTYNATHVYTQNGAYNVVLTGTDIRGCKGVSTKLFVANKPTVDAELISITPIINGNNYKPILRIQNNSNINIKHLTIIVRFENGTAIAEDWEGNLSPNSVLDYTFASTLITSKQSPVLCAEISSVNNSTTIESDYTNNKICNASDISSFRLTTIVPNPATNFINIGYILPREGNVVIELYDEAGNLTKIDNNIDSKIGYNNATLDISLLPKSTYLLYIRFDGETIAKKVVKL